MKKKKVKEIELESLHAEKRDKMNQRTPIWSLALVLFTGLGFAGIQSGIAGYAVMVYPLLAACIGRFHGHSERRLDRVKRRIFRVEQDADYHGHEHENEQTSQEQPHESGEHARAFRDFLLLTEVMATVGGGARGYTDHLPIWVLAVAIAIEVIAMVATWLWLRDTPAHQQASGPNRHQIRFQNGAGTDLATLAGEEVRQTALDRGDDHGRPPARRGADAEVRRVSGTPA